MSENIPEQGSITHSLEMGDPDPRIPKGLQSLIGHPTPPRDHWVLAELSRLGYNRVIPDPDGSQRFHKRGEGTVTFREHRVEFTPDDTDYDCKGCDGTGEYLDGDRCPACLGTGRSRLNLQYGDKISIDFTVIGAQPYDLKGIYPDGRWMLQVLDKSGKSQYVLLVPGDSISRHA